MTHAESQQLKALYVATSMYFGQKLPDEVFTLYVEDLADLPFVDCAQALKDLRRDPKTVRCPLPSAIRAKLTPESNPESEAIILAGRISGAIAKFGPYRSTEARAYLGPVAWEVVMSEGGWESVNQITFDDLGTRRAQWRNLAKVLVERGGSDQSENHALEDKRGTTGLTSLGDIFKMIPGPKEGA